MSAHAGDRAAATVYVAVAIEDAFAVFTEEIDLWWRRGRKFRNAGKRVGQLHFEPWLGGRLFETVELGAGPRSFPIGEVVVWEPPSRLALTWRAVNFKAHESTLVEVSFTTRGEGTMVRVDHSGWSEIPDGHPARHGLRISDFARMNGMWWGELLSALREYVVDRRAT